MDSRGDDCWAECGLHREPVLVHARGRLALVPCAAASRGMESPAFSGRFNVLIESEADDHVFEQRIVIVVLPDPIQCARDQVGTHLFQA